MRSKEGRRIHSYRGIPYAQPPLGSLRFKRPVPITCWSGTRSCKQEAKKSLQPHVLFPDKRYLNVGTEDCLYLSVFTKAAPRPMQGHETDRLLPETNEKEELL